jgi:hypothetical protein
LSFIFLKEISQTMWIQNVVNFNHALVLPPISLCDQKIITKKKERECMSIRKNFILLKLLLCHYIGIMASSI